VKPWTYAAIFFFALIGSGALVEIARRLSPRLKALDEPDSPRKLQQKAVPRLGGVAVILAFSAALLVAVAVLRTPADIPVLLGALVPALGAAGIGLWDDYRPISPSLRLVLLTLLAALAWWFGTSISITPFEWLNAVMTIVWVVAVTNAFNTIDNMDGLAASSALIGSLGTAFIAIYFGQFLVASLALALAGAAGGFLWHNWAPATIYLGDAGSYFFGFLLAILTIRLNPVAVDTPIAIFIPVLLLLLPIVDLIFVFVRRIKEGRHPFTPGLDHLSHSMQRRGLTPGRILGLVQVIGVVSMSLGVAIAVSI
jgi:UDP-GlcNAc:undecaprenyl-phosphate GlcNAc-1-phosphate transferase